MERRSFLGLIAVGFATALIGAESIKPAKSIMSMDLGDVKGDYASCIVTNVSDCLAGDFDGDTLNFIDIDGYRLVTRYPALDVSSLRMEPMPLPGGGVRRIVSV